MEDHARRANKGAEGLRPELSVVVASHDRPLRLRWLLNALEEQTVESGRWEVIVGHDSSDSETETLLETHPLADRGTLRHVKLAPGTGTPGANRNAALRLAQAPLVLFTDDDCRPPPDWLERALAAATRHPGGIVQGRTESDPDEWRATTAPYFHTQQIVAPPMPHAEACNILYPRNVLERMEGFNEEMTVGEDTDLMLRARRNGTPYEGDREMLTFHSVEDQTLAARLRWSWRWRRLPALVRANPEFRSSLYLRLFWKPTHLWLPVALAAAAMRKRTRARLLLALPWIAATWPDHGTTLRGRLRSTSELPGRLLVDISEVAALIWGSVRYRTPFL